MLLFFQKIKEGIELNTTIRVEHLKKSYGNTCVVNDISLSVNKGEVFGLLGANGAGKAPRLNVFWELDRQTAGQ